MAKIHNPQDQNGVVLINQTFFRDEKEALHNKIKDETELQISVAVDELRSDAAADLKAAVDELKDADADEKSRAEEQEKLLSDSIAKEESRAKGVETVLNNTISEEVTRATGEEQRLDKKIDDAISQEAARAVLEEGRLDKKIDDETEELSTAATRNREEIDKLNGLLIKEEERAKEEEQKINNVVDTLIETDRSLNNSIIALKNHSVTISNAVLKVENAAAQGFSFVAPMSGTISNIKVHCRTSGVIQGDSSSLVVYTAEKLTESLNEQTHNRNAILDFTFDSFTAVAGEKYRCIFEKNGAKINSCISTTPIGIYNSTDSIFQGKIQNANIQDHSGANVNAIFEIVYADAKLDEILSLCIKNNISSLGHIDNNTKHITSSERSAWNAKATTQNIADLESRVNTNISTLATKAEIANFVTADIVDEKIAAFEHHKPIFDINRDVDKVTFNLASSAEPQTVVLTLSEGKIFAGTVVASSSAISASLSTINPGVDTSFNVNIGLQETPAESGMAFVIVDTICDSTEYDNAQHVAEVIPVEIIVAAEA
jgi:hypothetical protein